MIRIGGFKILALILISQTSNALKARDLCKLQNGDPGMCMKMTECNKFTTNRTLPICAVKNFVCCPTMQRIVTPTIYVPAPPDSVETTVPPMPPVPPPTSLPILSTFPDVVADIGTTATPFVEVTTKLNSVFGDIATQKCEEYRHKVIRRASIITYVFGGTLSLDKEFPHMAALGYATFGTYDAIEWLCGGSLISDQFVLTAAHCLVLSGRDSLVIVRLGDLNLNSPVDDGVAQNFGVAQKIVHPDYRLPSQYNDIALIKLDRTVQFTDYVSPICLQVKMTLPNYNFIAAGWGRTELRGLQSSTLMKVDLDYFPNNACRENYATVAPESLPFGIVDRSQICAGSYTEEKDTCQGDSGGPLMIVDQFLYLVGITSFGKACGVPNSPAVYTRVSDFVPWIEKNVWLMG